MKNLEITFVNLDVGFVYVVVDISQLEIPFFMHKPFNQNTINVNKQIAALK
jgi:hypothetical protein